MPDALAYQDTLLEVVEAFQAVVSLLRPRLSPHVPTPELLDAPVVLFLPLIKNKGGVGPCARFLK